MHMPPYNLFPVCFTIKKTTFSAIMNDMLRKKCLGLDQLELAFSISKTGLLAELHTIFLMTCSIFQYPLPYAVIFHDTHAFRVQK